MRPASLNTLKNREHYLKMNGKEIFQICCRVMEKATRELLAANGFSTNDVDHVIPHQANVRIVESMANRLEIPFDKFYCNLDRHGNTSAASIPIALDEAYSKNIFKKEI